MELKKTKTFQLCREFSRLTISPCSHRVEHKNPDLTQKSRNSEPPVRPRTNKIKKWQFSLTKIDFFETHFLSIPHHSQTFPKLNTPQFNAPECNTNHNSPIEARKSRKFSTFFQGQHDMLGHWIQQKWSFSLGEICRSEHKNKNIGFLIIGLRYAFRARAAPELAPTFDDFCDPTATNNAQEYRNLT